MQQKKYLCVAVILSIIVISGFSIFKLLKLNEQLRSKIPYLLPDEKISYFTLLDKDARRIEVSALSGPAPSVIFIFSRPCSRCNKSIVFWNKIAELSQGRVNVYGIVMDSLGAAFEFEEKAKLKFKIYVPENIPRFQESLRVILNYPVTILYHKDGVKSLKIGDLENEDALRFIKLLKKTTQTNKD